MAASRYRASPGFGPRSTGRHFVSGRMGTDRVSGSWDRHRKPRWRAHPGLTCRDNGVPCADRSTAARSTHRRTATRRHALVLSTSSTNALSGDECFLVGGRRHQGDFVQRHFVMRALRTVLAGAGRWLRRHGDRLGADRRGTGRVGVRARRTRTGHLAEPDSTARMSVNLRVPHAGGRAIRCVAEGQSSTGPPAWSGEPSCRRPRPVHLPGSGGAFDALAEYTAGERGRERNRGGRRVVTSSRTRRSCGPTTTSADIHASSGRLPTTSRTHGGRRRSWPTSHSASRS